MTRNQIQWCKSHDWYVSDCNNTVTVGEIDENGIASLHTFDNIHDVRVWAGY